MPGTSLSRWTMAYFAAACAFLLVAQALLSTDYGYPGAVIETPQTLAVVHLLTVGWFGLLMSGALLQFVPVLVAQPLRWGTLALPALMAILAGDASLVFGFTALGGVTIEAGPFLSFGALSLIIGYLTIAAIVGRTLAGAWPLALPARFVALGLVALVATLGLGSVFAFVLSGYLPPAVGAFLPDALPLHAALGLGGWLTVSAIGVSYRLLPMFLLTPDSAGRRASVALWTAACAIFLLLTAVLLAAAELSGTRTLLVAVLVLSLTGLAVYGLDLVAIYRARRRPRLELNSLAGLAAFIALFLGGLWFAAAAILGRLASDIGAIVYLLGFGWLTGLGLAKLYKIIPFLTWLECYGPVLGRTPTPRVQDLVSETRARIWFMLFHLAVFLATVALALGQASMFRAASGLQFAMTVALVAEFLRARVLAEIAPDKRLPHGAIRPNLFLPSLHPTRPT